MTDKLKKIVVLISGSGTNLKTLIDNCLPTAKEEVAHPINAQIVAVFSDQVAAGGLDFAREANIDAHALSAKVYDSREAFDDALAEAIDTYAPDLIVLAGYMRILSARFVNRFEGKLINIHPSLLPKFPGLNTHQRAIDAGEVEHGTSVHFVDCGLDSGPVILQAKVPVFPEDTEEELTMRVKYQEHQIYPLVVRWFVDNRLVLKEGVAFLDGHALGNEGYAP